MNSFAWLLCIVAAVFLAVCGVALVYAWAFAKWQQRNIKGDK